MRSLSRRWFFRASVLSLALSLLSCAGRGEPASPPPTAEAVDLARYAGLWYEIARLPMWAQRDCLASTAEYRLLDSGEVHVRNACVTTSGREISIDGTATVIDLESRARLNVVFDQWAAKLVSWFTASAEGNYWILRIDPDYRWTVVGTPDRTYLWILARTPLMDGPLYQELVEFGRQLGFPTERLIRSPGRP